jgi:hypothetical protein
MLYSKRRKNLGGGRKKRSNRRSNKQSMRGGAEGMMIMFNDIDAVKVEKLINAIRTNTNYMKTHINKLFAKTEQTEFFRDNIWGYSSLSDIDKFTPAQKQNHFKAIRNLQKIIYTYGIHSFIIYDGLSANTSEPTINSKQTIYYPVSSVFFAFETYD